MIYSTENRGPSLFSQMYAYACVPVCVGVWQACMHIQGMYQKIGSGLKSTGLTKVFCFSTKTAI